MGIGRLGLTPAQIWERNITQWKMPVHLILVVGTMLYSIFVISFKQYFWTKTNSKTVTLSTKHWYIQYKQGCPFFVYPFSHGWASYLFLVVSFFFNETMISKGEQICLVLYFFWKLRILLLCGSLAGARVSHKMKWSLTSCVIYAATLLWCCKKAEIITFKLSSQLEKKCNSYSLTLRLSEEFFLQLLSNKNL